MYYLIFGNIILLGKYGTNFKNTIWTFIAFLINTYTSIPMEIQLLNIATDTTTRDQVLSMNDS